MKHLNGNMFAAIDVETTGLKPRYHDLFDIAVIPLDSRFVPLEDVLPFNMRIKPKRPDNFDPNAFKVRAYDDRVMSGHSVTNSAKSVIDAVLDGIDPYDAAELFVEWFEELGLGGFRRLIPVAHNWVFDYQFIEDWLGDETMAMCFHPVYRDTMSISAFENDVADTRSNPIPYAKNNLAYLCSTLKVDQGAAHNALDDALSTAEVMRKMMQMTPVRPRNGL